MLRPAKNCSEQLSFDTNQPPAPEPILEISPKLKKKKKTKLPTTPALLEFGWRRKLAAKHIPVRLRFMKFVHSSHLTSHHSNTHYSHSCTFLFEGATSINRTLNIPSPPRPCRRMYLLRGAYLYASLSYSPPIHEQVVCKTAQFN